MSKWWHRPQIDDADVVEKEWCYYDGELWPCDAEQMRLRAERAEAAARAFLDASDMLDRWDAAHGYVINSERDALDGDRDAGLASLRRALEGLEP